MKPNNTMLKTQKPFPLNIITFIYIYIFLSKKIILLVSCMEMLGSDIGLDVGNEVIKSL